MSEFDFACYYCVMKWKYAEYSCDVLRNDCHAASYEARAQAEPTEKLMGKVLALSKLWDEALAHKNKLYADLLKCSH